MGGPGSGRKKGSGSKSKKVGGFVKHEQSAKPRTVGRPGRRSSKFGQPRETK